MVIDYRCLLVHREERLQIRGLVEEDVTAAYAGWLNDEGNRSGLWIDSGQVITVESQREYIRQIVASEERAITGLHIYRESAVQRARARCDISLGEHVYVDD